MALESRTCGQGTSRGFDTGPTPLGGNKHPREHCSPEHASARTEARSPMSTTHLDAERVRRPAWPEIALCGPSPPEPAAAPSDRRRGFPAGRDHGSRYMLQPQSTKPEHAPALSGPNLKTLALSWERGTRPIQVAILPASRPRRIR
jgi:hypothetical protein